MNFPFLGDFRGSQRPAVCKIPTLFLSFCNMSLIVLTPQDHWANKWLTLMSDYPRRDKWRLEFPGSLVVRIWHFHCCDPDSVPSLNPTSSPCMPWPKKKKRKEREGKKQVEFYEWTLLLGKHTDSVLMYCTPIFIAALFTITKTGKQPKCPSTDT